MSDLAKPPHPVWLCTRCDYYWVFGPYPEGEGCLHCGAPMRESVWSEEPRIKSSKELYDDAMASSQKLREAMKFFDAWERRFFT